jgi:ABC-type Fe3+/spermidine/putrescine transport system ATPase subunit
MSITIDAVEKSFGEEHVLSDVELTVDDGEFCIIIGPSGCGKTTLLNCVAGLVRPDEGDVRRDGESLLGTPINERDFGIVFQDFEERLFPHMTVAENVAFGLRQSGDYDDETIEQRIDEVLDLLAISQTRDDYPPNLSGGQQQRVELARQLVRESETLLLDDPLSDLDYKLQKQLELELRRLQDAEGDTILYVTHNQDQSLKLADQIVVMNRGTIEQVAPPAEVYYEPATAFVARFIGDSNLMVVDDAMVENGSTVLETEVGTLRAATEDDDLAGGGVAIVRPEDVRFGNGENTLTGTLEQRIYTGETTEFVVSIGDVIEEFRVQNPGEVPLESLDASIGEEVTVSWSTADTHYFEPDELSVTGELAVDDLEAV